MTDSNEIKNVTENGKLAENAYQKSAGFLYSCLDSKCPGIVAGVSGGADSMCMLLILDRFIRENMPEMRIVCAHFNHMMRGEASDGDEEFVKNVCGKLGITFRRDSAHVEKYASENGISEEMAGRKLRYEFFGRLAEELGEDTKIAVAHTENDRAETVFMNIARGSGTEGLKGIAPKNGRIIRPCLTLSRKETEAVCLCSGYGFRTDGTNKQNIYKRNIVRNLILPHIEEHFEGFGGKLISLSETASEENDYIREQAEWAWKKCAEQQENGSISVIREKFAELHPVIQKRVVRICAEKLSDKGEHPFPGAMGFDRKNTEKLRQFILTGETGKTVKFPGHAKCRIQYDRAEMFVTGENKEKVGTDELNASAVSVRGISLDIPLIGETVKYNVPGMDFTVTACEYDRKATCKGDGGWAMFDLDAIMGKLISEPGNSLTLRYPKQGDIFRPFGLGGGKELRRFLTDAKIPLEKRQTTRVLAIGNNILWIPGIRRSDFAPVEKETNRVIIFRL